MRSRLADTGVYYGWFVAGACFLAAGSMFGLTYSFSIFFDALQAAFDVSPARVSLVFGVQTFVIYVAGAGLGRVFDRVGPRRLLAVGTVLLVGGLLVAARADSYLLLAATYGVVTGLGMSCCFVVAYATVPTWFERRRGAANGLAAAGLGAGLLVVAPTASWLVETAGWRAGYDALAVGLLAALGLAVVVMADAPADVGADRSVEFSGDESEAGGDGSIRQTVGSLPFLLVVLGWVGVYATLYVLVNHLVPYADGLGVRWAGVTAISVMGIATIVARLVVGAVSDRMGRVAIFTVCSLTMGASLLALPLATSPLAIVAIAVVFGVGYGGNGALLSPLVADLFGTADIGTLFGIASLSFAVAGLLSPPLATLGVEELGTYTPVFLGVGVVGVAGAVCIALAGRTAAR